MSFDNKEVIVIYHQIRFSVKPDVPKAELEASLERLRNLGRQLDVVQFWVVGRDFGADFEYGALYALPDIDAYRTYMYAPLHLETVRDNFIDHLDADELAVIGRVFARIRKA